MCGLLECVLSTARMVRTIKGKMENNKENNGNMQCNKWASKWDDVMM